MDGAAGWSQAVSSSLPAMLLTVAAGALAVYFYAPSWRLRRIPGPLAYGLLGNLPMLDKYGSKVFGVLAKQYGPIYRFYLGRQPLVLVSDPDLCREVGIKKFKSLVDRSVPVTIRSSPIRYKSLLFTKGSTWQSMRNVIISIYQPSHLASLIPGSQHYIERSTCLLCPGEEVTFSDFSLKLFSDITGQATFGVDFGLTKDAVADEATSDFIQKHLYATTSLKIDLSGSLSMILGTFMPMLQEPLRQLLLRVPGSVDRRMHETITALSDKMDGIVAARAAQTDRGQKNFLSVLLNAMDSSDAMRKLFTPDYVSALTYEHLLAGTDTMSFTLSSLVYLVSMHPEVEDTSRNRTFGPVPKTPLVPDGLRTGTRGGH